MGVEIRYSTLYAMSVVLGFLHLPPRSHGQIHSIGDVVNYQSMPDGILLNVHPAALSLTVVSDHIIRVRCSRSEMFLPDSSWAVENVFLAPKIFHVEEDPQRIILRTPALRVRIDRTPCRLSFFDAQGRFLNGDLPSKGIHWVGEEIAVSKHMPEDEFYYGFGEKAGSLQRKWHSMSMWNTDSPGYRADTDPLYQTIPFFYGIRNGQAHGIFFDNTYFSFFNMGKQNPAEYTFGALGGELNYYFIAGPSPEEVNERYTKLVGRTPLPPRWSIGYQQSRYSYFPEKRVREIASEFRERRIPCDVIYLDIHYMDGYRCFTWDAERFPQAKTMIGDLAQSGFKIVTIIDPGIKIDSGYWVFQEGERGNHFVRYPDGRPFVGKVWPGECVFPDFTRRETRDWWGSLHEVLLKDGIRGIWTDMNEPSVFDVPSKTFDLDVVHDDRGLKSDHRKNHNIYGMQMARATYEGMIDLQEDARPFVLTRAGYAGGNRYAAVWTGDNISSWEHLEMTVPMCLNLSISGQPFVGSDIGGFVGSPSGELFARWLQLGVFTPLMRTHTEFGTADQEPWSYGEDIERVNRKTIELRYRLLPYLYTQFYRTSTTGTPIMRPLFFDYPDDRHTYWQDREFMFGDAFLVAPVLWPGSKQRDVRLPGGEWYDYWSRQRYQGPTWVRVDAPIDKIPLFVRAGSIIPTQQVLQYSDQAPIDPLTMEIFPGTSGTSIFYEDDGVSFEYQKGKFLVRSLELTQTKKELRFVIAAPEGKYLPPSRSIVLKVIDIPSQPREVILNGKRMTAVGEDGFSGNTKVWRYDAATRTLWVHIPDRLRREELVIR